MFPQAAPAGCLSVNGDLIFNKPKSRVTIFAQGSRAEARTIFTAAPGQNAIFGAMPGPGAPVAGIQVYSVNLDSALPGGFRYGDLRATPGFIQMTCAALGADSSGVAAPSPWPFRFLINGRAHVIGIDGSWSFNIGQTILDANGNLGLGVTTPAAKLEIGPGGMLQFDSPGGNSFRNGYPNSDLLLTWNFNAGATIMSLDNVGNLAVAGTINAGGGIAGLPATTVRIAQVITSGSQATIDFSSIPAGYTQLELVIAGRDTNTGVTDVQFRIKINNDNTASHYNASQYVAGTATTASAGSLNPTTAGTPGGSIPGSSGNANAIGGARILFPNYSQTVFYKIFMSQSLISSGSGPTQSMYNFGSSWRSPAAINQITVTAGGTAFVDGTCATLYGIP